MCTSPASVRRPSVIVGGCSSSRTVSGIAPCADGRRERALELPGLVVADLAEVHQIRAAGLCHHAHPTPALAADYGGGESTPRRRDDRSLGRRLRCPPPRAAPRARGRVASDRHALGARHARARDRVQLLRSQVAGRLHLRRGRPGSTGLERLVPDPRDGDRPVQHQDARRDRDRLRSQPGLPRGRRDAEGAPPSSARRPRDAALADPPSQHAHALGGRRHDHAARPAFYHRPVEISDIVDQTVLRILDQFDFELEPRPAGAASASSLAKTSTERAWRSNGAGDRHPKCRPTRATDTNVERAQSGIRLSATGTSGGFRGCDVRRGGLRIRIWRCTSRLG